jgi:polyketide biosynthesis enoyl-CoA hydratase PksI
MAELMGTSARDDDSRVRVVAEADGVVIVHLCDAQGGNAFSPQLVSAFLGALDRVGRDESVRAIVLRGLPEVFASGATREVLEGIAAGELPTTELSLGRRLMSVPVPVIAACEGHAVGGGLALALSADLVVLAAESRYGANFLTLGITPGMGTTRLFEHVMGPATAHELLYTGAFRRGSELAPRLFAPVVPRAEVFSRAVDLALAVAEKPRGAVVLLKRTLTLPRRRAYEEAMTLESLMHETTFQDVDPSAFEGGAP